MSLTDSWLQATLSPATSQLVYKVHHSWEVVSPAFSEDDGTVLGGAGTQLNDTESLSEKGIPFSVLL